jgi:hypothetical protein
MTDSVDRDPAMEPPDETTPPVDPEAQQPEPEPTPEAVLTPLELHRQLAVASQPPPWQPADEELDPNAEVGWEKAAAHELPAIRPEDLPALDPTLAAGHAAPDAPDGTVQAVAPELALVPRDRVWRRGARRATRGIRAAIRPLVLIVLFGAGVALGWTTWVRAQPIPQGSVPPAALEAGTTDDIPTPVQSLVAALNSDNQTQLQTVVPAEPYRLLAGELSRRDVARIQGAKALATYSKDGDSATEILIGGYDSSNNPVVFNLVVHIHQGSISEFR